MAKINKNGDAKHSPKGRGRRMTKFTTRKTSIWDGNFRHTAVEISVAKQFWDGI